MVLDQGVGPTLTLTGRGGGTVTVDDHCRVVHKIAAGGITGEIIIMVMATPTRGRVITITGAATVVIMEVIMEGAAF